MMNLNTIPQGRYKMIFGCYFVQIFDPGFCYLVSGPQLGTDFLYRFGEFVTL